MRVSRTGWAVSLALTTVCLLALRFGSQQPDTPGVHAQLEPEVSPLPAVTDGCRAQGAGARAHAVELEQQSLVRWESVPVMPSEAPHAIAQLAEAEACFAAAGDRMGRTRTASTRRVYVAELLRRFTHARLMLRAATRDHAPREAQHVAAAETPSRSERAGAEERVSMARRQLAILVALLERAPPSVWPYRDELSREARRYAALRPTPEREESGP